MADLSDLEAGGGVLPQPIDQRFVFSSTTYVAPVSGTLAIRLFGADGSAGISTGTGCATGAGAGEVVDKLHPVTAGDSITITLGAGGASVTNSSGGPLNGNDGGNSTITGPNGLAVTAVGGKAGKAGPVSAGTPLAGGLGGSGGTGGDIHRPGGRGGNIANCNDSHATGGGAPNDTATLTTAATRGGDVLGTPTGPCATGGGGFRGRGADITSSNGATAGGGAGGDALDGATAAGKCGPNIVGLRSATAITLINNATAPFGLNAIGCGADGTNAAGDGGGGSGGTPSQPAPGGSLGGLAGYANAAAAYIVPTTPPLYGAPSGVVSSTIITTLKGRDGFAILRLYPRAG